jgi:hypothetical protein
MQWDKIIPRFENIVNNTEHFSTGCRPTDLYPELPPTLNIDPRIFPERTEDIDLEEKKEQVRILTQESGRQEETNGQTRTGEGIRTGR